MILLRGPSGCPWDRRQTLSDVRAYLIEEAHETATAIDEEDWSELSGELGDLLFQVVFISVLAEEAGHFDLASTLERIRAKMVARHPHVFGDEQLPDARAVQEAWEKRKIEKEERSVLEGVPKSLPSLVAAFRIGQKAGAVGFDWPDVAGVRAKVDEELAEIDEAATDEERREEIGDLLFAVAQLARWHGVDPDAALARANTKFRDRFARVERAVADDGRRITELSAPELEAHWQDVKAARSADAEPRPHEPRRSAAPPRSGGSRPTD